VLGGILQRLEAAEVDRRLEPRVETNAHDRRVRLEPSGRSGLGQVGLQSGDQTTVGQYGGENTARQITQRFQRVVDLRADFVKKPAGANGRCIEQAAARTC